MTQVPAISLFVLAALTSGLLVSCNKEEEPTEKETVQCQFCGKEFDDLCRFFHGVMDIMATFNLSQMNKIGPDVTLFVQWEYPKNSEWQKNVFHYLMEQLVARYGEGSFIAYNPNLTKKDLVGRNCYDGFLRKK